jgi:predicted oxidoreductase
METQHLCSSEIKVSRLSYGCMRISGSWDRTKVDAETIQRGIGLIETAIETGYTFFDHADIYGDTACESIFGQALAKHPYWRDRMVIASKCAICFEDEPTPGRPHRYDFSYDHIIRSVEDSLKRLQTDRLDLLMLHRPDFLADPHEIAIAFDELRAAGKVLEFGVSNFRPTLLSMVQSALSFPLQVNQVEIHPLRLDSFTDGTLDQCLEKKVTPMAWSPLAGGKLGSGQVADPASSNHLHLSNLLAVLDQAALEFDTDRTSIVLAWLLRHPAKIIPVIGTVKPENIRIAARAPEIKMDRDTWYRILLAARGEKLP